MLDEADALFAKRSEVEDGHDRYANIDISHLLQRMEAFPVFWPPRYLPPPYLPPPHLEA